MNAKEFNELRWERKKLWNNLRIEPCPFERAKIVEGLFNSYPYVKVEQKKEMADG